MKHYSRKIYPASTTFPLTKAEASLSAPKVVENSVVCAIDESLPFKVKTDAFYVAVAVIIFQFGRPVAFLRTLQSAVKHYPSIEKAQSFIEVSRNWRCYLAGSRFPVKTDQRSVRYMFDRRQESKFLKILRWRIELSCYNFDI